jgi:LPXTG-motif cell wall-anchored protein
MKSIRCFLAALAALVAMTSLAHSTPAFATNSDNPNDAAYWLPRAGDGATCAKHNPGDETSDGEITDGGTSVTLNPGNWVLLVVKSGSEGPNNDGNLVYDDPVAGTAYSGPLNAGGQQGAVSHWIVCTGAPTPQPDTEVTEGHWTDGTWACGATTVEQTRTITTTTYLLVAGQWQPHTENTIEHQTRPLTTDEQFPCDIVVPTQSPAFVDATCTAGAELVLPDTPGVTYTQSGPAAAGETVAVTASAQQGYVLAGVTKWEHTFTTPDASQCSQSQATPPIDPQTGPEQGSVDTPAQPDQSASAAPTAAPTQPTTQLPKTGNDHVTLLALIAAMLLGGGVALRAGAARRRT